MERGRKIRGGKSEIRAGEQTKREGIGCRAGPGNSLLLDRPK